MTNNSEVSTEIRRSFDGTGFMAIALILALASMLLSSCSTTSGAKAEERGDSLLKNETAQAALTEEWGVEVVGIRHSAAGYMLDFRYKVVDPDKAAPLLDRQSKAFLIDEASGVKVQVPVPAKIGPLRQTIKNSKPRMGTTYMVLFANPGQYIAPGSKVTVAIGDFRAKNLTVQ